jgi:hypothetical protein
MLIGDIYLCFRGLETNQSCNAVGTLLGFLPCKHADCSSAITVSLSYLHYLVISVAKQQLLFAGLLLWPLNISWAYPRHGQLAIAAATANHSLIVAIPLLQPHKGSSIQVV